MDFLVGVKKPRGALCGVCWRNIDLNIFVIWGVLCCREVPKELTKQELEAQQKKEEEMKKEAKKKEGGLLGFLMQQTSAGKAAEKGGLEFSLANLFKCMCFTHEDPEDSKKQLVNVIVMFSLFFLFSFQLHARSGHCVRVPHGC